MSISWSSLSYMIIFRSNSIQKANRHNHDPLGSFHSLGYHKSILSPWFHRRILSLLKRDIETRSNSCSCRIDLDWHRAYSIERLYYDWNGYWSCFCKENKLWKEEKSLFLCIFIFYYNHCIILFNYINLLLIHYF